MLIQRLHRPLLQMGNGQLRAAPGPDGSKDDGSLQLADESFVQLGAERGLEVVAFLDMGLRSDFGGVGGMAGAREAETDALNADLPQMVNEFAIDA